MNAPTGETVGNSTSLTDILDRVNLPDLIARECGAEAIYGLHRERGGLIRDPRPGHHERHGSFSVYRSPGGRWRWKRHGGSDADKGDALGFLLALGYNPQQAREELARIADMALTPWAQVSRKSVAHDPLQEARAVLDRCAPLDDKELRRVSGLLAFLTSHDLAGRDLQQRGLHGWKGVQAGKLRHDFTTREGKMLAHAGALGFLLRGPDGQPWGLKVRNLGTADALRENGLDRYVYRIGRHGAPAWCSPGYGQGDAVLIVEGELNGAAASRALTEAGQRIDVQGLAGAGGTPFLTGLHGRPVYLYADPDPAGRACLERVSQVARAAGAREVRVLSPLPEGDFCDFLGQNGITATGTHFTQLLKDADLVQNVIWCKKPLHQNNTDSDNKNDLVQWCKTFNPLQNPEGNEWGASPQGWGSIDRGGW